MRTAWAIVLLCMVGLSARADMIVSTADGNGADTFVGNDSNKGPNNNYGASTTLDIRNYTNVRAHIGYVRFDITSIGGVDPTGARLQLFLTQAQNSRTWNIYGVKDGPNDFWNEMTITYNNSPWMLPASSGNFALDETKVTLLGTMFVPAGGNQLRTSDPASLDLASFIKQDTNNLITLILVGPADGSGTQYYVLTKEGQAGATDPAFVAPRLVLPAVPNPFWAANPNPAMNQVVSTNLNQLCWSNPEPNSPGGIITCDVYFGTREPNRLAPNYDLEYTLAVNTTNTCVSLPVSLAQFTRYYWVVDVRDSSQPGILHRGRVWSFNTFNLGPSVNTGADQYIWLGHQGTPGVAAAFLNATVTDDGLPGPLTYLWEQLSGPAVTISPNNVEDITVVFTEAGDYTFRLTASDGAESNSDSVRIFVGADACAAAKAVPGFAANRMDFNSDCLVNLADLATFAAQWMDCRSLSCP
ncbi:MAG TPA: DNRLRE domain-containing protein [Anaerohalosphaeraceae bacterium]|nr:DNRLRE domain-containing protein [Anaerohalosphaeraceae bacterium]